MQRIYRTTNLKVGDWLIMEDDIGNIRKGYIEAILSSEAIKIRTNDTIDNNGNIRKLEEFITIRVLTTSNQYRIYPDKDLSLKDAEYKGHIYNLALDTGDTEWLKELIN